MQLISFSGIDGAGKSTQIELTEAFLRKRGLKVATLVTLYCSLAGIYARLRERFSSTQNRSAQSGNTPNNRIRTYRGGRTFNDDRCSWGVRLRRFFVYPIDCFLCSCVVTWYRLRGIDVLICDRYVFDKLVCLANPTGWQARLVGHLVPKPDVAILLDVVPAAAEERKPEHATDYYESKADSYREVQQARMGLTRVPGMTIEETQQRIRTLILANRSAAITKAPRTESIGTA